MEDYLSKLNEQQRAAVEYLSGPELVIAGAGSGKTRVLTYKIVHLLENGYPLNHILTLTFTNKAAKEMRKRIEVILGQPTDATAWMGTFHSVFAKILHINAEYLGFNKNFTIYDTADSHFAEWDLTIKYINPIRFSNLFRGRKMHSCHLNVILVIRILLKRIVVRNAPSLVPYTKRIWNAANSQM